MKKRIIALLLSLSVFLGTFALPRRASAAAPAIGAGIFAAAWEFIYLMTLHGDEVRDAIRYDMENGWDGLTNPDSPFQQEWRAGWEIVCDTLQDWISCNKVTTNGDVIKLTHDQYLDLYNQVISVMSAPSVDLDCRYFYQFLSVDLANPIKVVNLPTIELFYEHGGESYAPVYFNDSKIVFVGGYYYHSPTFRGFRTFTNSDFNVFNVDQSHGFGALNERFAHHYPSFNVFFDDYWGWELCTIPNCWVYENGMLTMVSSDSVDVSGMISGYITTTGDYGAFLNSISNATSTVSPSAITGALSDLINILPTAKNPTLSIPLDPDLDRPLEDQIQVEIDGEEDKPLSDYLVEDFEIPEKTNSELLKKFPFCIPYDFVRFLGVLAADPIPPVFHIPISTRPQNLEQWADNETLGQYVAPDNPMFEINEEITLDFSHIPLVRPICNFVFIIGFVFLLLHVTTKFIQH